MTEDKAEGRRRAADRHGDGRWSVGKLISCRRGEHGGEDCVTTRDSDAHKKARGPSRGACGRRAACSPLTLALCVACALYLARLATLGLPKPPPPPPLEARGGEAEAEALGACCELAPARTLTAAEITRLNDGRLPVTIALMNGGSRQKLGLIACDVPCEVTLAWSPAAHVRQVDVLLERSNIANESTVPNAAARLGGLQARALSSMESTGYYAGLEPSELKALGVISMTTSRRSDVPVTYLRKRSIASWGARPAIWTAQRLAALDARAPLISMVASNCGAKTGRAHFFAALRDALGGRADSLGRCGRTAPWPACADGKPCSKHGALRRYPFYFAAENSEVDDYVTEKVYDALEAGVVPVYMGAPNAAEFLPPGSALFVPAQANASAAAELARALLALAASPARYAELVRWRSRPLDADYARRWAPYVGAKAECRLCRFMYARRHAAAGNVSWSAAEQQLVLPPAG